MSSLAFSPAYAQEVSLHAALQAKENGNFTLAEDLLIRLLADSDGDAQLWFQLGLVQRFSSQFEQAMNSQLNALALAPANQDIRIEIARIQAARGESTQAAATLEQVLQVHPNHPEAVALAQTLRARAAERSTASRSWRVDAGTEHSTFARQPREDWWLHFIQVGRRVEDTSAHLRVDHVTRFDVVHQHIEVGASRRLAPRYVGNVSVGHTPDAEFLPQWRVKMGLSYQYIHYRGGFGFAGLDVALQHDRYAQLSTTAIKPGVRIGLLANVEAQLQHIGIADERRHYLSGWSARINWQVPAFNSRLFAGVADAPETESARTVDTHAAFIGARYQWSERAQVHVSYAREDRERAYVRSITSVAISVQW